MYTKIVISGIIGLFVYNSHAQSIHVGPEFGGNLIQLSKDEMGKDFQLGYYGGATFEYQFNPFLSVRSGVYFSQGKQATSRSDTSQWDLFGFTIPGLDLNTYTTVKSKQTQNYIQIPILANYTWKNINVFGGGYAGFMIGNTRIDHTIQSTPLLSIIDLSSIDSTGFLASFLPEPYSETYEESYSDANLRSFDFGLKGGVGYTMNSFRIQCSYSFGIPDFRLDRGDLDLLRHHFFQSSICYMFQLTGKSTSSKI